MKHIKISRIIAFLLALTVLVSLLSGILGMCLLFLLTYLHCETDDFGALMDKYSEHVKWYDPDDYQRLPSTFAHLPLRRHGDPAGLRVMRCTYDRSGSPTTVTHIFVRIAP